MKCPKCNRELKHIKGKVKFGVNLGESKKEFNLSE